MSTDQDPGPVETGTSAAPASTVSAQQAEEQTTVARLDALANAYELAHVEAIDVVLRVGLGVEEGTLHPSEALPEAEEEAAPGSARRIAVGELLKILIRNGLSIDDGALGQRIEAMATDRGKTPEEVRAVLVGRGLDAWEQFDAQLRAQIEPPEAPATAPPAVDDGGSADVEDDAAPLPRVLRPPMSVDEGPTSERSKLSADLGDKDIVRLDALATQRGITREEMLVRLVRRGLEIEEGTLGRVLEPTDDERPETDR